jgi:hypothetical protein
MSRAAAVTGVSSPPVDALDPWRANAGVSGQVEVLTAEAGTLLADGRKVLMSQEVV